MNDPYRTLGDPPEPERREDSLDRWLAVPRWLRALHTTAAALIGCLILSIAQDCRPNSLIVPMRVTVLDRQHEYEGVCRQKGGWDAPCMRSLNWAVHFNYNGEYVYYPSDQFQVDRMRRGACYWVRATATNPPRIVTVLTEAPTAACLQ